MNFCRESPTCCYWCLLLLVAVVPVYYNLKSIMTMNVHCGYQAAASTLARFCHLSSASFSFWFSISFSFALSFSFSLISFTLFLSFFLSLFRFLMWRAKCQIVNDRQCQLDYCKQVPLLKRCLPDALSLSFSSLAISRQSGLFLLRAAISRYVV